MIYNTPRVICDICKDIESSIAVQLIHFKLIFQTNEHKMIHICKKCMSEPISKLAPILDRKQ